MNKRSNKKRSRDWRYRTPSTDRSYYSIGEVARMFDIEEHVLRYWEEMTPLKPRRSPMSDARMYTKEDIELVRKIQYLVQVRGVTLSAVPALLENEDIDVDVELRSRLEDIRERLSGIAHLLQGAGNE